MNPPLLSIITISKDDPPGLERTLTSVAAWRDSGQVEHIVVHSGVPPVIPHAAALRFQPQRSQGIAPAFNEGLAAAQGEWVWFLNGGDAIHECMEPAWLLTLLRNSRADIVIGTIHGDGDEYPRNLPALNEQWPLLDSWPPHPATLVRRKLLSAAGGFTAEFRTCMDFELWQRLLGSGGRADVISVPFARFNLDGLSSRPESLRLRYRENGKILWRYQGSVWRSAWRALAGLSIRVLRGWWSMGR